MATAKQKETAKENFKKAQAAWKGMSSREHARAKPGTKGKGEYYRIVVRPKEEFATFRYHDVGEPDGIQRLAGKRSSGSWADQAWLISKDMAHLERDRLVADTPEAQVILNMIGPAKHVKGDMEIFFRDTPEETFLKRRSRLLLSGVHREKIYRRRSGLVKEINVILKRQFEAES